MSFLEFLPGVLNTKMTISARPTKVIPSWHWVVWFIFQSKMGWLQEWNDGAKQGGFVLYEAAFLLSLLLLRRKTWSRSGGVQYPPDTPECDLAAQQMWALLFFSVCLLYKEADEDMKIFHTLS